MSGHFLNREVGTRLLKGFDLAAFTMAAAILATLQATDATAATPVTVGFFAIGLAFFSVFCLRGFALYEWRNLLRIWRNLSKSIGLVAFLGFTLSLGAGLIGLKLPLAWTGLWLGTTCAMLTASRVVTWLFLRVAHKSGHLKQRVVFVGGGKSAEEAIATLEKSHGLNLEILGLFDDRYDTRSPDSVRRYRKLGRIGDLAAFARTNPVDLIIVAIPLSAEQRLLQILKRIWELPIDIRVSGQAGQLRLARQAYSWLGELPLLPLFDRPLNPWNQFLKDCMDRVIAALALVILSPVMAAVALAVRLESRGPIIFKQKRYGFNNELIEVFKFRSMYSEMGDATASKLVSRDDPRVTGVGRMIRKSSLDELPQLFNVLQGKLSLVGPRPHATQAKAAGGLYDEVVEGYFARHKVKPGITGWAQVKGWRGETDTVEKIKQRVKHDLEYINGWSLGFDLYILMKTPLALLKSENAY